MRLGFSPNSDLSGTAGINNKGQVVFAYQSDSDNQLHAWMWLPDPDYGFPTAGFKDLTALSGSPVPAIAREVNENGLVVGQAAFVVGLPNSGRGAVWSMASGSVLHTQLGTLLGNSTWSSAWSINNANPPTIVGDSGTRHDCVCALNTFLKDLAHGFRMTYVGAGSALIELFPDPDAYGQARDVNTAGPVRIVGNTDCNISGSQLFCLDNSKCAPRLNAVLWQPDMRVLLAKLSQYGAEARGINDNAESVGWARTGDCLQQAVYWVTPGSVPTNLGNFLPVGHSSRAEAINNRFLSGASRPQVVGWDTQQGLGALWEMQGDGTWMLLQLNSIMAIGDCSNKWILNEAHDINDNGWIITWGVDNAGTAHAILLTPFPSCPVDVTQNGCVNVDDLLAVINGWGDCLIGVICKADVNGDCRVNVDDLLAVNNAWCPTCPTPGGPCCTGCCTPGGAGLSGSGLPGPLNQSQLVQLVLQSHQPPAIQATIIQQILQH